MVDVLLVMLSFVAVPVQKLVVVVRPSLIYNADAPLVVAVTAPPFAGKETLLVYWLLLAQLHHPRHHRILPQILNWPILVLHHKKYFFVSFCTSDKVCEVLNSKDYEIVVVKICSAFVSPWLKING